MLDVTPFSTPHLLAVSSSSKESVEAVVMDALYRSGSLVKFTIVRVPRTPSVVSGKVALYVVGDISADCRSRSWKLTASTVVSPDGRIRTELGHSPAATMPGNALGGRELRMVCGEVAWPQRLQLRAGMTEFAHAALTTPVWPESR